MSIGMSALLGLIYYMSGFVVFYIIIYKILPEFKQMIYGQDMRGGEKRRYYLLYVVVSSLSLVAYLTWLYSQGGFASIALTGSIGATILVLLVPLTKDLFKGDYFKTLRLFHGAKPRHIIHFMVQWSVHAFYAEFDYVDFASTTLRDIHTGGEISILNRDMGKYQITNLTKGAKTDYIIRNEDDEIIAKIPFGYVFNVDFYLNNNIDLKKIESLILDNVATSKELNPDTNELDVVTDDWITGFIEGDPEELKPKVSWSFYPGYVKSKLTFRCDDFEKGLTKSKIDIPKRVFHLLREKGVLLNEVKDTTVLSEDKTKPQEFNPNLGVQNG